MELNPHAAETSRIDMCVEVSSTPRVLEPEDLAELGDGAAGVAAAQPLVVMGAEQRQLLMAMDDIHRVVDIEPDRLGRGGIARSVQIDHDPAGPDQIAQVRRVLEPFGDGGRKLAGNPHPPCCGSQEHHAPSDDRRPPSNAAATFRLARAGKAKERPLTTVMTGRVYGDCAKRIAPSSQFLCDIIPLRYIHKPRNQRTIPPGGGHLAECCARAIETGWGKPARAPRRLPAKCAPGPRSSHWTA